VYTVNIDGLGFFCGSRDTSLPLLVSLYAVGLSLTFFWM